MDRSEKTREVLRFLNIAFYKFIDLPEPEILRQELKALCTSQGVRGSILVSPEGINGCLAGEPGAIREWQALLARDSRWRDLEFKESYSDSIPFQRLFVKLKKEIIPTGIPSIQPHRRTAPRLTPSELRSWIDEGRDFTLLDTRNHYETQLGSFRGAKHLNLAHFRHFPEKMKELPESAREKPLVMFCTGGIRCEKASVVALEEGFREVYQLDGGILNYFRECGDRHYEGSCFVFDERVAVTPKLEPLRPSTHESLEHDGRSAEQLIAIESF
jgi:UPF0176 protein